MSVEYSAIIKRNSDKKEIGHVYANEVKAIYNLWSDIPKSVTYNDLMCLADETINKIKKAYDKIKYLELKTIVCKTPEIKAEFETSIDDELEYISGEYGLFDQLHSIHVLIGKIKAVVSDIWSNEKQEYAYTYNAPEPETEDGKSSMRYIDESDVYIEFDNGY